MANKENKANKVFSIPNILSFIRIGMIPFIVWMYSVDRVYISAILVVISGLTDIVDGFIARHFNMVTTLGKALDPIADKLTIFAILVSLCIKRPIITTLLGVFVLKEVLMGVEGLLIIKYTGTTYSAKWYGKIATLILYASALMFILWRKISDLAIAITLIICIVVVLFSFIMYTIKNIKVIKSIKNNHEQKN